MIFEYKGFSKLGGIYQIKNTISGGVYVGSTIKFYDRWTDHKRSLTTNKHKTKHLQNAYNKYLLERGTDDFLEFSVLELMENSTKEERLIREEWWIDKLIENGVELYNTNKKPTKEPIIQSVMSLEGKEKMIAKEKASVFLLQPNINWEMFHGPRRMAMMKKHESLLERSPRRCGQIQRLPRNF